MLLSQITDGNLFSVAIHDGHAKQLLRQEDALAVMTKGSMAEVRKECLRLIKPVVDGQVVLGLTTKFSGAAFCMLERVAFSSLIPS